MTRSDQTAVPGVEEAVKQRYTAAARVPESALCCPVEYSADFLSVIPEEVLAKDYGCGDPSPYVREGDTVVDLGSGAGKLCYILAQAVDREGRVIGIDCNREMLALAGKYQPVVADRLGYANVEFRSNRRTMTARHCFGCTAGAGSGCQGAVVT
jgi:2-polyprenyl-3-methyl-5-hydroxy-6-metoxy-1,4-benzoquinol methylase